MRWLPDSSLLMKGRLARRTFVLLLIAASLPILIATWVIVGHTNAYVDKKAHRTLTLEAKKYGLGLLQRLELAATAMASAPMSDSLDGEERVEALTTLDPYFSSIRLLDHRSANETHEDPRAMYSATVLDRELPALDATAVRIVRDDNGTHAVALVHGVDPSRWRIGVLRQDYLWQRASLTEDMFVRVSDGAGRVLFASLPEVSDPADNASVEDGESAQWELFLEQRFAGGKWHIDLLESYSDVKVEFARYKRTLLFTLVPLVGALVLFSSISIRRTHRPLEALTEATHRIAAGDFRARVTPSGDEDIRSLAVAFNGMTQQIGRHFDTLAVLSQLDRQILSSSDLQEIVFTVLKRARDILPCGQLAMLVYDEDCSDMARIHVARHAEDALAYTARIQVPKGLHALLQNAQTDFELDAGMPSSQEMQRLMFGCPSNDPILVLPIRTDKGAQGALLLSCSEPSTHAAPALDVARGLAERMAVAISNADRQHALVRQAHYDGLTQLPNRLLFKDRLAQQIAHCQRSRSQFALLFLDLDRFKNINDSFGHTSGDELLKGVAARLVEELSGVDTIARLGGDEFTIITPGIESAADAANAAQSVIAALARPILLGDIEHFVSASIGIAVYPQDGVTTDVLLRNADIAMYRAKSAGTGRFAYYEEAMNREAMERVELENELRHALARDELSIVYQPRIDLRDETTVGVEALSRWRHARFGMVPPDRFIRIAEDSGLIIAIGDRVLRQVCEQYHHWRLEGIELQQLAVNVSVRQLQAPGFAKCLRGIIKQWGIPPGVMEIEITESVLASDIDYLTTVLNELHAMGVKIAIDDFGTGYSSLSYLRLLPIDTLKVDRAFLPTPGDAQGKAALCEAILAMSKALDLSVVAEGVETIEQLNFLKKHGCDVAQGFYFSRPVTAAEIAQRFNGKEADRGLRMADGTSG